MASGIYIAMAGAVAQSSALDTVSNNIANAGTAGFKAERVRFGEALSRAKGKDAAYVAATGGNTDNTEGQLVKTDNALDAALVGDGYFGVQTAQGVRYTRAGNFGIDGKGTLVTADGHALRGEDGKPLTIPAGAGAISIHSDGSVFAGKQSVGTIELVKFDPSVMKREGATLYSTAAKPITDKGKPELQPGTIEQGNFNVVRGMVDLVKVSRTYEALHKMIESYKEMDDRIARGGQ